MKRVMDLKENKGNTGGFRREKRKGDMIQLYYSLKNKKKNRCASNIV